MATIDFKAHLQRQLSFLQQSCLSFDAGFHDEAIRMATSIRVLIHNTKTSTSLLKHLNATTINLLSTAPPTTPNTIISKAMGTIQVSSDGGWSYFASLGTAPVVDFMPVSRWWEREVMVHHPVRLTRRKIVLAAANQDGGAHVDEKLNAEYHALTQVGFAGMVTHTNSLGTKTAQLEGSHFVCLRQMGYELLNSPALLDRAGP